MRRHHRAVILADGGGVPLRQELSPRPDRLAVLPARGVHWDDLGEPARVMATRRRAEAMAHTMPDTSSRDAVTPQRVSVAAPA